MENLIFIAFGFKVNDTT